MRNYHEYLIESLQNKEELAAYLETSLEDGADTFAIALRNAVEASRTTELHLEIPIDLPAVVKFLEEIGLRLRVMAKESS